MVDLLDRIWMCLGYIFLILAQVIIEYIIPVVSERWIYRVKRCVFKNKLYRFNSRPFISNAYSLRSTDHPINRMAAKQMFIELHILAGI